MKQAKVYAKLERRRAAFDAMRNTDGYIRPGSMNKKKGA